MEMIIKELYVTHMIIKIGYYFVMFFPPMLLSSISLPILFVLERLSCLGWIIFFDIDRNNYSISLQIKMLNYPIPHLYSLAGEATTP